MFFENREYELFSLLDFTNIIDTDDLYAELRSMLKDNDDEDMKEVIYEIIDKVDNLSDEEFLYLRLKFSNEDEND